MLPIALAGSVRNELTRWSAMLSTVALSSPLISLHYASRFSHEKCMAWPGRSFAQGGWRNGFIGRRPAPRWMRPHLLHFPVAQLVEHSPVKRKRTGSMPVRGASFNCGLAQLAEHLTLTQGVAGSIPASTASIHGRSAVWVWLNGQAPDCKSVPSRFESCHPLHSILSRLCSFSR